LPDRNKRLEELEFRLLEASVKEKALRHREDDQRYLLKWVAAIAGIVVIVAMGALVTHLVHHVFWGPFLFANAAFTVAMIVAPITSITAITVALFVGAFRKFDDKDLEKVGNGVSSASTFYRGG
jgi:biotin transporter BioY